MLGTRRYPYDLWISAYRELQRVGFLYDYLTYRITN